MSPPHKGLDNGGERTRWLVLQKVRRHPSPLWPGFFTIDQILWFFRGIKDKVVGGSDSL